MESENGHGPLSVVSELSSAIVELSKNVTELKQSVLTRVEAENTYYKKSRRWIVILTLCLAFIIDSVFSISMTSYCILEPSRTAQYPSICSIIPGYSGAIDQAKQKAVQQAKVTAVNREIFKQHTITINELEKTVNQLQKQQGLPQTPFTPVPSPTS